MPNPDPATANPALLPDPALFDVTDIAQPTVEGRLERVALEHLTLAPNPRRQLSTEGIERLAGLLMRTGPADPVHRPAPTPRATHGGAVRRPAPAARRPSQPPAGRHRRLRRPRPGRARLIVLLLDHDPSGEEIRRIQAQANNTEALSLVDQQTQFADCWQARATLHDDDRIIAVCADLGISAKKAHNLRRQLTLPEPIRERVADRPAGAQLSVTMANRLADMHDVAPQLTEAVAGRITSRRAARPGAPRPRRVRAPHRRRRPAHLRRPDRRRRAAGRRRPARARPRPAHRRRRPRAGRPAARLRARHARVRARRADRARPDTGAETAHHRRDPRPRARPGASRSCTTADPTSPPASGSSTRSSSSTSSTTSSTTTTRTRRHAKTRSSPAPASPTTSCAQAAHDDQARKQQARLHQAEATRRNLGLGHDLRAGLMDPTPGQLQALKAIICHLLAAHYRDVIAFGAGWTDQQRQQPVGDTGRHEPRHPDAILDAELQHALDDPDPLRGIAQLTARWAAAFLLDPDGITRTKTLGTDRMARKLARRASRRPHAAARRRLGVHAADALPRPGRHAPRRLPHATRRSTPPCAWPNTAATRRSRTSTSTTPSPPDPLILPCRSPAQLTGSGGRMRANASRSWRAPCRTRESGGRRSAPSNPPRSLHAVPGR